MSKNLNEGCCGKKVRVSTKPVKKVTTPKKSDDDKNNKKT
jgi:hypothetical protein